MACFEKHLILQPPPPKKKENTPPNKHTNKQKKPTKTKQTIQKPKKNTLKIRYLCNESVNNTAGKVMMIIIIVLLSVKW